MSLYDKIKELALKEIDKCIYIYMGLPNIVKSCEYFFGYYINFFNFFQNH